MSQRIKVGKEDWKKEENRFTYCEELEKGNLLFFESPPFDFPQEEIDFLLKQKQGESSSRKNIAYKPQIDKISNHAGQDPESSEELKTILRSYSQRVTGFLFDLLSPYKEWMRHDYASFRPFQESGRPLRRRARNDLLHVDAFPTRPLHGCRILRFFTNINPKESREWITSDDFEVLAKQFLKHIPEPKTVSYSLKDRLFKKAKELARKMGVKVALRSPYDSFMLQMHHFLKENEEFQKNCPKDYWSFPPMSCWAVFTDMVSHAAISGQYALEQTFIIPQKALLCPEKSPVRVLERLTGKNLVDVSLLQKQLL